MPLYEFLLTFAERTERRVGDRPARVGEVLTVGGRRWRVEGELPRSDGAAFRLVPLESGGAEEPRAPARRRRSPRTSSET